MKESMERDALKMLEASGSNLVNVLAAYNTVKGGTETRSITLDNGVCILKEYREVDEKIKTLKKTLEDYEKIAEAKNKIKYGGNDSWNSNYKKMAGRGFDGAVEWVLELLK